VRSLLLSRTKESDLRSLLNDCSEIQVSLQEELSRHLEGKEIAFGLVLRPRLAGIDTDADDDMSRIKSLLLGPKRLKTYRPVDFDSDDLEQNAFVDVLDHLRTSTSSARDVDPLPRFPVQLTQDESEQWERFVALWPNLVHSLNRDVIPALGKSDEAVRANSRDRRRELFRKTTRRAARRDPGLPDVHDPAPDPGRAAEGHQTHARLQRIAARRHGEKGLKFLSALLSGETVSSAQRSAGLTRRQADRLREDFRKQGT